jgi:hypothetical protein
VIGRFDAGRIGGRTRRCVIAGFSKPLIAKTRFRPTQSRFRLDIVRPKHVLQNFACSRDATRDRNNLLPSVELSTVRPSFPRARAAKRISGSIAMSPIGTVSVSQSSAVAEPIAAMSRTLAANCGVVGTAGSDAATQNQFLRGDGCAHDGT